MADVRRSYPKKITTAMVGLSSAVLTEKAKEADGAVIPVLRLYGRIKSTEEVNTTYGNATRFKGEFEAINLLDNSVHRSQICFVPAVAEQVVLDLVGEGKADDEDAWVKFGLDLTVQYKPNVGNQKGTEFRFGVRPLIEAKGDDVLSQIGRELGAPPALENSKAKTAKKK